MIRVFLICLACCCSSLMSLKQSGSIVSEDHTQVVERKSKNNYYAERQYDVLYSINAFASDIYWQRMVNELTNNQSSIALGGTTNVSLYDIYYNGGYWGANQTTLDSTRLYICDSGYFRQVSDLWFTGIDFHVSRYSTFTYMFLNFSYNYNNVKTYYISYKASFESSLGYIGCSITGNSSYNEDFTGNEIISLNKSGVFVALNADTGENYDVGYRDGYEFGFDDGWNQRQASVDREQWEAGYQSGVQDGISQGYQQAQEQTSTALTIFTGILEVGLLPVNVFLKMFEYEVFGINIAGFISGLLTIAMVMIFIRFIFGGKNDK